MFKLMTASALLALAAGAASAANYEITITNTLEDELLAPILVTDAANDDQIFNMAYVTEAAEHQVLTGEPTLVVESIGADMTGVVHGEDGPPGVLLASGKSVTFEFETEATALRFFAMVAPTKLPDNYVTTVVDVSARDMAAASLDRFDIGHDEGTMMTSFVADGAGMITITRK